MDYDYCGACDDTGWTECACDNEGHGFQCEARPCNVCGLPVGKSWQDQLNEILEREGSDEDLAYFGEHE